MLRVVAEDVVIVGVVGSFLSTPPTTIEPLLNVPLLSTDSLIELGSSGLALAVNFVRRVVVPGSSTGVPENTSIDLSAAAVRVIAESSNVRLLALFSFALRS